MFFERAITSFVYLAFFSTMIMSITVYKNARFDPIDARSMMSTFSPISTVDACRCECYNNIICSTATYFGINRTCVLFYAQLNQGQLRVVPTVINATVSFFGNRSSSGKRERHLYILD
jgi:hypothetical protein